VRIIQAARGLLRQGASGFGVAEVARRAGVTRRTIYQRFGSRAGLVDAVVVDFERGMGIGAGLISGPLVPNPSAQLKTLLQRTTSVWYSDEDLLRAIFELGTDPEIRAIIERHDAGRRAAIRREASRLAAAGALRGEVSARAAAGVLWFLTSFETYDFMRRRNGLGVRATASSLATLARSILA
jgi:AcrR family transcriptional regulator